MGKTLLTRLAAVAAGGTLALAAAAPALAHDEPAEDFNSVLHGPHHGLLAADDEFEDCANVLEDAGSDAESLVKEGFDVWVFNVTTSAQFDLSADVLVQASFEDLDGATQTVTVPGEYDAWIGPEANPHLVAVSVPAGWTLLDGDFNATEPDTKVVVTHTCAGVPGENREESENGGEEEEENGEGGSSEDEEEPGGGSSLPVTGVQVGGLVVLGAGLLAAGIAMVAVRRRGSVSGLSEE